MKKTVLSVLLVALCLSAVFASGNIVKASVVPYGLQIATSSVSDQKPIKSGYGFGAQVSYQRDLFGDFFAEAGLTWGTFLMPEDRPAFSNILIFAGMGYKTDFTEELSGGLHLDVGTDTLIYKSAAAETITVKLGLDLDYALNEKLSLAAGCDGVFGFSKKTETNYVNYRVIPTIGVSYEF